MLTRKKIRAAFLIVTFCLMLVPESVLARRNRNPAGGGHSRGNFTNRTSRRVENSTAGSRIRQPRSPAGARPARPDKAARPSHRSRLRNPESGRLRSPKRIIGPEAQKSRGTKRGLRGFRERKTAFDGFKRRGIGSKRITASGNHFMFRRPANERKQHVRLPTDKSQHIKRITTGKGGAIKSGPAGPGRRDRFLGRRKHRDRKHRASVRPDFGRDHVRKKRHRRRHGIFRRVVWPGYHYGIYYHRGPYRTFRYFYPYHHRKYVFVSLGGYWPIDYGYLRYYWYGWHPYRWYGYYPDAYEVQGQTYNYYTYNYYDGKDDSGAVQPGETADGIRPVDENTFADVREKLAEQAPKEPERETKADRYFDDAVKAFEQGNYNRAAGKLADALELEPGDVVMPFAYVQALFADEQYSKAVRILREALVGLAPEEEGVFYPRGLYPDDDVLFEQIDRLAEETRRSGFDADLQLLLGYQLLGAGKLDRAEEPLQQAGQDLENADAAGKLLELLEKIKSDTAEEKDE